MSVQTAELLTSAPTGPDTLGMELRAEHGWRNRNEDNVDPRGYRAEPWMHHADAYHFTPDAVAETEVAPDVPTRTPAQIAQDALSMHLETMREAAVARLDQNRKHAEANPDKYVMVGAWLLERTPHPFNTRKPRRNRHR